MESNAWAIVRRVTDTVDMSMEGGWLGRMDVMLTMDAYYDGPRSGACTLNGLPMFCWSTWEDMEDDDEGYPLPQRFLLAAMRPDTMKLVVESESIWQRWGERLHGGPAVIAANAGLPEDRQRWRELGELEQRERAVAEWCCYVELEESGGIDDKPSNGLFWVKWKELTFPKPDRLRELHNNQQEYDI